MKVIERFDPRNNGFGYTVVFDVREHACDAEAFAVAGVDENVCYYSASAGDMTLDIDSAEPTLTVWVKWDGCSEFTTGGDTHLCGWRDWQDFIALQVFIYTRCAELIPNFDLAQADLPASK